MFCYAISRDFHGVDHLYRFESELARDHWFCRTQESSHIADFRFPVSRQFADTFIRNYLYYNPNAIWDFDLEHNWYLVSATGELPF